MDLTLRNLSTVSNHSRFGCEMMFVNSYTHKPSKLEELHSIDDEYCPAVFKMVNVDLYGEGNKNMLLEKLSYYCVASNSL